MCLIKTSRILIHYLLLNFLVADRLYRRSRTYWSLAFLEKYLWPRP